MRNADYFMWEKFTTKPLVDQQTFRRLGDCPTPWPCFVIAVRDEFITNEKETLQVILEVINSITETFKEIPEIDAIISERYQQKNEDVKNWLALTEWSQENICSFNSRNSSESTDAIRHHFRKITLQ